MRIVFCGTPEFALPSLNMLVDGGYDVVGVFAQPDKPVGRKAVLQPPPVKVLAEKHGLPVYQFADVRKAEALEVLRGLRPDLMITASFGQLLSQENLDIPPYGCINVHASLLPRYRGASPIQSAIIAGERVTGVTTMYTILALDAGDMLLRETLEIHPDETAEELFPRLAALGAQVLEATLKDLRDGALLPTLQDESRATVCRMLKKQDGFIHWAWPAARVHNLVRGCNPWPTAQCLCQLGSGERIPCKVWRSHLLPGEEALELTPLEGDTSPGARMIRPGDGKFYLHCGEGVLEILEIQKAGGKRLRGEEFLRGHEALRGLDGGAE